MTITLDQPSGERGMHCTGRAVEYSSRQTARICIPQTVGSVSAPRQSLMTRREGLQPADQLVCRALSRANWYPSEVHAPLADQPGLFGLLYMLSWAESRPSAPSCWRHEHEERAHQLAKTLSTQLAPMKTTKMASCSRLSLGLSSRTCTRDEGGQWLPSSGGLVEPVGVGDRHPSEVWGLPYDSGTRWTMGCVQASLWA